MGHILYLNMIILQKYCDFQNTGIAGGKKTCTLNYFSIIFIVIKLF